MTELTKKYEGLRLTAYQCPAGVWTIGYGTTCYPDGTAVKEGDEVTEEQAEAYLNDYMIKEVYPVIDKIPYVLIDCQRQALESLIYNWGAPGFLKSKLFKAICAKDYANICREWDYGFKNNLLGIFKRRAEELHLFMRGL